MSSNDDIMSDLSYDYPKGYPNLVVDLLHEHARLELSIADLIGVEYGMEQLETFTMIGKMDLRGRIDKLSQLYAARGDTNGKKIMASLRSAVTSHVENRNYVVHGLYIGYKNTDESGNAVYYATTKHYLDADDDDKLLMRVMMIPVSSVSYAIKVFAGCADVNDKFVEERRQRRS